MAEELGKCCRGAKGVRRDCLCGRLNHCSQSLTMWVYRFPAPLMWMEMRLRLQGFCSAHFCTPVSTTRRTPQVATSPVDCTDIQNRPESRKTGVRSDQSTGEPKP